MEFTEKEKAALIGVLSAIIYADGFIDQKEVDYMGRIKYELGISDELMPVSLEIEPSEAFEIISAMSDDKKKVAGEILMKMAYIDKELDATEYRLVAGILLKCGIVPD